MKAILGAVKSLDDKALIAMTLAGRRRTFRRADGSASVDNSEQVIPN
jgi:hypothetical protein